MLILELHKTYVLMMCTCGQRHTFTFDHGGVNSKPGPFVFNDGDTVTYRFDDDGPNLGMGPQQTVTLNASDFPDIKNVTTDQLVEKINSSLTYATATNDYGTVLVESKTAGPTSCVEVIDGYAARAMGYNVRGDSFEHFCCGRMVLGYVPPFLPRKEHTEVIMLRRCNACKGQPTIIRNMTDHSNDPEWAGNVLSRKACNTLAIHLKGNGWVDPELISFYQNETANPPEYFPEFFGQKDSIVVATYEEVIQRMNNMKAGERKI